MREVEGRSGIGDAACVGRGEKGGGKGVRGGRREGEGGMA